MQNASTRLQYMMSTNWSSGWSPSVPITWSTAWSTRLLMDGAKGSWHVFVPREDILNICFVEHEHYFFACLTMCLRNFINVTEIAKTTLCVPQIPFSCVLPGNVETLFRWSEKSLYLLLTNLFRIMCSKFYKNWLSFVEDITKTILVCLWDTV